MNLVPGVYETILCKIVRQCVVAGEPAQEVPDLGLVSANQFSECTCIPTCDDTRN